MVMVMGRVSKRRRLKIMKDKGGRRWNGGYGMRRTRCCRRGLRVERGGVTDLAGSLRGQHCDKVRELKRVGAFGNYAMWENYLFYFIFYFISYFLFNFNFDIFFIICVWVEEIGRQGEGEKRPALFRTRQREERGVQVQVWDCGSNENIIRERDRPNDR